VTACREMEWRETEHKTRDVHWAARRAHQTQQNSRPSLKPAEGGNADVESTEGHAMKLLMIDNYDSFTYNIVQYFGELGATVTVARNDEITLEQMDALLASGQMDRLVISPGPCSPAEAGISVAAIRHFAGRVPVLGVCLGHQSIGAAFGGTIVRAQELMHGKTSVITTTQQGVFAGLPQAVHGQPLPLAGHRAQHLPRLSGGHRLDRRRRGDGHSPQNAWTWRACSSTPKAS
jgi:anthranilate synthase/aminodeoxychorismate synthase-like glutamine amidotransferase